MMQSNLTYEEYLYWCKSRRPAAQDLNEYVACVADTTMTDAYSDICPVTVRSNASERCPSTKLRGSR